MNARGASSTFTHPKGALAMHGLIASDHSTHFARIVALDLGKFNSVACVYDPKSQAHVFTSIGTAPQTVHDLLSEHTGSDPSRVLVIFETCDAAGWVHDVAAALGFTVAVANPCDEAWRWRKVKRKTDRDDALKLVRLALVGQLRTVHMPGPRQRQRRRLIHHRKALVERQTQTKNAIRSIFSQQGMSPALPRGHKLWSQAGVAQLLSAHARPLEECEVDDLWRGRLQVELQLLESLAQQIARVEKKLEELGRSDDRVKLLRTVPGVGPRLAEAVVAHLDDPHRFRNARQVSAYAGLVPKQLESGTMKRVGRITHQGPSLLRGLLVEVAWMAYRYNAWAKRVVEHVSRGMKQRKKIAVVALARRLLVRLWAMLRDNTPWRDPTAWRDPTRAFSPPEDTGPVTALSSVAV
jgi:transposase